MTDPVTPDSAPSAPVTRDPVTLLVSDIHLSAGQPRTAAAFEQFLAGVPAQAQRLIILGDLFEYWAGDDDATEPFNARMLAALRRVADAGVQLQVLRGNRDFLIDAGFAAASGARLLGDPVRLEGVTPAVLLTHGDALCIDDAAYMAFRATVRSPAWRHEFLARPLSERKQIIHGLRARSEDIKRHKPMDLMDVNAQAVVELLESTGVDLLIHGHTHRPARHVVPVAGRLCERVVLTDWDFDVAAARQQRGGGVRLDAAGVTPFAFQPGFLP